MFITHFNEVMYRTPDPTRPGKTTFAKRMEKSGTNVIVHEGVTYEADDEGWFDVPESVGIFFSSRPGWRTPAQVDSEVSAGLVAVNDSPVSAKPKVAARPKR